MPSAMSLSVAVKPFKLHFWYYILARGEYEEKASEEHKVIATRWLFAGLRSVACQIICFYSKWTWYTGGDIAVVF